MLYHPGFEMLFILDVLFLVFSLLYWREATRTRHGVKPLPRLTLTQRDLAWLASH